MSVIPRSAAHLANPRSACSTSAAVGPAFRGAIQPFDKSIVGFEIRLKLPPWTQYRVAFDETLATILPLRTTRQGSIDMVHAYASGPEAYLGGAMPILSNAWPDQC